MKLCTLKKKLFIKMIPKKYLFGDIFEGHQINKLFVIMN